MSEKVYNGMIKELSDLLGTVSGFLTGYWDFKFLDGSEIPCRHGKRESLEGTAFCVWCGVEPGERIYQSEYDDSHAVRAPVDEEETLERECYRTFNHSQGRCGYPAIKPDVLIALKSRLSGERVTKPDAKDALKEMGLQRHNKYVHHIHHLVTGVPKNDIEKYEDILVGEMDYISGQFMVKENKINKQFLMMLLLESHGETYDRSEFFFPKSMEKYEVGLREFISEM